MLEPAPTTQIDPELARGRLARIVEATATKPAYVVLEFANTDYQTHLLPHGSVPDWLGERVGKRVVGTIRADAKRIDVTETGGKYVEPVFGRPRRLQGRVISRNAGGNTLTIHCGFPVIVKPTAPGQKAEGFSVGDFVAFDVKRGATFEAKQA